MGSRIQPKGRRRSESRKESITTSALMDVVLEAGIATFLHALSLGSAARRSKISAAGQTATWPDTSPITPAFSPSIWVTGFTVWAPFNMPWSFTYLGYGAGVFPPGRAELRRIFFESRAHREPRSVQKHLRAIKAASSKATVGSAYGMAPAYPRTDSEADRAATARYHAMNNVYFLDAAMSGRIPEGVCRAKSPTRRWAISPGDDKIMKTPLDWLGFHYYTRRFVSAASRGPGQRAASIRHGDRRAHGERRAIPTRSFHAR